jgi:hypothetical protein
MDLYSRRPRIIIYTPTFSFSMERKRGYQRMRHTTLGLLLLLTGCSPAVSLTKLWPTPLEPRPANYPIRFFREQRPRCAFDELATVSARPTDVWHTNDKVIEVLRLKAREVGGDAIIGFATESQVTGAAPSYSGNGGVALNRNVVLSGTIVRFKNPQCTE